MAALSLSLAYISVPSGALEVHFLDIGQGDAIFVQTPNGRQVLIDAGSDDAVLSQLAKVMPFYDKHIDLLVISHMHADHYKGFHHVLERFSVGAILVFDMRLENEQSRNFWRLVEENEISVVKVEKGYNFVLDDGVDMLLLYPWKEVVAGASINESSIVAKLTYDRDSFLFTGDIEKRGEINLVSRGIDISADVLKVSHHGSDTSSMNYFLSAVEPKVSIIQSGEGNRYNHPHRSALRRLQNAGSQILRNDLNGVISIYSYGNTF